MEMLRCKSINEIFCLCLQTALVDPSEEDYDVLSDRLKVRLREGQGEFIYEVGTAGE